jgi:hypothetical protein
VGGGSVLAWFALVTFVLSFPSFGAKAGGSVTAIATFTMAWRMLVGKTAGLRHLAAGIAAGFALVFVWAATSHLLGLRTTHLQSAVDALLHGRFGYIHGVSVRKAGLAVQVFLHPGTLWGLAGLALISSATRLWLWPRVAVYLRGRPSFRAAFAAGLWGCLVAVLFNDSGIVAAILLFVCLVLPLLHGLFSDHAPSRT